MFLTNIPITLVFMTSTVKLLNTRVIGIFVRNIERCLQRTSIGILAFTIEDPLEKINVVRVDGSIEGNSDHLRNLSRIDISRDPGTIRRTETVRELTLAKITVRSSIGILINSASIFI